MRENYVTAHEMAARWNISIRQVQKLCMEGKVPGAFHFGKVWAVPSGAAKPTRTARAKPGRKPKEARTQDDAGRNGI
jgi:hypothetical protein